MKTSRGNGKKKADMVDNDDVSVIALEALNVDDENIMTPTSVNDKEMKNLKRNAESESFSKHTIQLTNDKVCQLVGAQGTNLKLIERLFKVKIKIDRNKVFYVDEEEAEKNLIDVEIQCINSEQTFDNKSSEWFRNLIRYLKSVTRGGFVKKMPIEEYERLNQFKGGHILNEDNLKTLEDEHNVEIVYNSYDDIVYVCVLERFQIKKGYSNLEKGILLTREMIHARYQKDSVSVSSKEKKLQRGKDRDRKRR